MFIHLISSGCGDGAGERANQAQESGWDSQWHILNLNPLPRSNLSPGVIVDLY